MTLQMKLLAGSAAVVVIAAGILGVVRMRQQPRFPYMTRALPEADYAAMAAKPGWRAEHLAVAPGIQLRGLVREPAAPGRPWVLFFNGNSPNMLREGQQFIDALCASQGWGGVVWAYRGYDSSDGTPDASVFVDDGLKAYSALLAASGASAQSVHIVGFSMGTGVAAAVTARAGQNAPGSLTLLAPMTTLYHGERAQLFLHRHETLKWLPQITSPVLVIHGNDDTTLPVENSRTVAAVLGSRGSLLELPGVGHIDLPTTPAAQDALRAFIAKHSAGAAAPQ